MIFAGKLVKILPLLPTSGVHKCSYSLEVFRTLHLCNTNRYSTTRSYNMPVSTVKRGAFIVFEGCDRSGKTTQCKMLVDALKKENEKVEFCRFPERDTAIGRVISDYLEKKCELDDHAVHLLFTANRWEAVPQIKEKLSSGITLICDRYSFSGVAYTAAKQGMSLSWCRQPEIGLPRPDAVLYLTLSAEEAAKRAQYGGERYEETEFQKQIAGNYKLLREDNWKEIDASKNIDDLHSEIKVIVKDVMTSSCDTELGQLWTNHSASGREAGEQENVEQATGDAEPVAKKLKQDSEETGGNDVTV